MSIDQSLSHEAERIEALQRYNILETEPESHFDDIATLAAQICGSPYAAITFVEENRCWFKAVHGFAARDQDRVSWPCADAIRNQDQVLIVNDTQGQLRVNLCGHESRDVLVGSYAGVPILSADGKFALGTLCVLGKGPREFGAEQISALRTLARQVTHLLELRRSSEMLEMANIKMQMLAERDPVSGLPSERMFRTQLRIEFQYSRRHDQPLSLVILDIDGFGQINQQYGTERGDEVLKRMARILGRATRDSDLVARSGGDEFAILMRNADADVSMKVAERLTSKIASMDWRPEPVTASIGVSTISVDMISSRDMVERARKRLIESREGRQIDGTLLNTVAAA